MYRRLTSTMLAACFVSVVAGGPTAPQVRPRTPSASAVGWRCPKRYAITLPEEWI